MFFLIAETADGIAVALVVVADVHAGAIADEVAVVRVGTTVLRRVLRRTPEGGGAAGIVENTAVVVARRHSTETGGVVTGRCVPYRTLACAGTPPCGGGQRLGDVNAVAAASVLALAAHIILQLSPFRIAW